MHDDLILEERPLGRVSKDGPRGTTFLLLTRQQRGIAAGSSGVDRYRLFGGEKGQIMRASGLWARTRQPVAAERLHADHRADHVAVDINVTGLQPIDHVLAGIVDPRGNAESPAM